MTDKLHSLIGKYFINVIAHRFGRQALMRGQVLGPIHEMLPLYLCKVFPGDDMQIAVPTETLLSAEQLVGVYFFEQELDWQAHWVEIQRRAAAQQVEEEVRAKREQAQQRINEIILDSTRDAKLPPGTEIHHVQADSPEDFRRQIAEIIEKEAQRYAVDAVDDDSDENDE